jgi:hypothetical protein
MIREFFWPDGGAPGWAIRWEVGDSSATAEVTAATATVGPDGLRDAIVLSDGGAGDVMLLDGPWIAEMTVEVKFDGYMRLWTEDMQLGHNGVRDLVPLFYYLTKRGVVLVESAPSRRAL